MPSIEKSIEFEVWYQLIDMFRNSKVDISINLIAIQTVYSSFKIAPDIY